MKKILFISHDATRTGAPILLLNLLKLLKNYDDDFKITTIVKNGFSLHNDILNDFVENSKTIVWHNLDFNLTSPRIKSLIIRRKKRKDEKLICQVLAETDYIFTNTITNGDFFDYFKEKINKPVYCYVHELEIATSFYTTMGDLEALLDKTNYFFSPSHAVSTHLKSNLGINASKIFPLNYFIPFKNESQHGLKKSSNFFNVGIVGTLDWRKGADIIVVIVSILFNKYSDLNIRFIWKGADLASIEYKRILQELNKSGYFDKIKFEPSSNEVNDFYETIDILLLPSKEDPYPLVVLEAASFSKPTICFNNAGGAPEFVETDAGSVVPYLDIPALVEEIYSYYLDNNKCNKLGLNAFLKYKQRHMNEILIISQLFHGLNLQNNDK